ncbi:1-acyl-sn-glycerol-3-phosphate acyltransferase, partial [Escherichia coli]|nr:1-acyl-sn-glycerol-3-phosphate acyltransferase [Escherichia coli]
FEQIEQALNDGEVVCIFPEGRLTSNGELGEFRPGVEKILERNPVPVIPMALKGLWGSFFSHKDGHALTKRPTRFWSKVDVVIGDVL